MKVIATNLGRPTTVVWNGKEERTGIYKYPVDEPIFLGTTDVEKDSVIDRKHHGGHNKACYLFGAENYTYWKSKYPHLEWDWGMFGENLTISGLDEEALHVGATYTLGGATVQITVPREPCYKLGIRFKDQNIIKAFLEHGHPGTYVRVLREGAVTKGDPMVLKEPHEHPLSIREFYLLLFQKEKPLSVWERFMEHPGVPRKKKDKMAKYH